MTGQAQRRWASFAMLVLLAASALFPVSVRAQSGAAAAATIAPDLVFPSEATKPDELTKKMALLVPSGQGPFPAIVMLHQCAGLNPAVIKHARKAAAEGFVVLMTDSFGSRDVSSVCYGPRNGVNLFRGVRDALQGVEHLRSLPIVDKNRVGLVGYSWGAMVALMAGSPMYRSWLGFHTSPGAVVAHYPGCFTITPANGRNFEVFSRDVDVPTLALLGSDDTETPADECERKFKTANFHEAINWNVYPGATHCWDCQQIDGQHKIDVRGNSVSYRYNAEISKDAIERTFTFLRRSFSTR